MVSDNLSRAGFVFISTVIMQTSTTDFQLEAGFLPSIHLRGKLLCLFSKQKKSVNNAQMSLIWERASII